MSKSIVAKFRCHGVEKQGEIENVTLGAVCDDSPENKEWSKWTPSGQLTMAISNPEAQGAFEQGKCYKLTLTEYPAGE